MATPLLSSLREPPVIGRYYMVPVVVYEWHGVRDAWPVLGPLHHDKGPINFPHLHYHLDQRFLSKRQFRQIASRDSYQGQGVTINGTPLTEHSDKTEAIPRRPRLARRLCAHPIQKWVVADKAKKWGLQAHYSEPHAEPIRMADGRLLCPHRKVDLSQVPPDADGIVTCPLHGLRVRCAA